MNFWKPMRIHLGQVRRPRPIELGMKVGDVLPGGALEVFSTKKQHIFAGGVRSGVLKSLQTLRSNSCWRRCFVVKSAVFFGFWLSADQSAKGDEAYDIKLWDQHHRPGFCRLLRRVAQGIHLSRDDGFACFQDVQRWLEPSGCVAQAPKVFLEANMTKPYPPKKMNVKCNRLTALFFPVSLAFSCNITR